MSVDEMKAFLGYKMFLVVLPATRCAGERLKFSGNKRAGDAFSCAPVKNRLQKCVSCE